MTEPLVLTAMAHPLRRRLLDVLRVHGPATVGHLASRTDQAAGNVSHHMRILASAGLVEEAPELARDRREHWWRRPDRPISWSTRTDDPETEAIALAASGLNLERAVAFVRAFAQLPPEERAPWTDATFATDSWLRLTPDELREYSAEMTALIQRWAGRDLPDDGEEREPVFTFAYGVPARP